MQPDSGFAKSIKTVLNARDILFTRISEMLDYVFKMLYYGEIK